MSEFTELNSKILAKNLEITKLTAQLDSIGADLIDATEKLNERPTQNMIKALKTAITYIDGTLDDNDDTKLTLLSGLSKAALYLSPNSSISHD